MTKQKITIFERKTKQNKKTEKYTVSLSKHVSAIIQIDHWNKFDILFR